MKVDEVDTEGVDRESQSDADESQALTGGTATGSHGNGGGIRKGIKGKGRRGYDSLSLERDGAPSGDADGAQAVHPPKWFWAGLLLLGFVLVLLLATSSSSESCPAEPPPPDYTHYQQLFTDTEWEGAMRPEAIKQNLDDLTYRPHVAGTPDDLRTAKYVRDRMREYGWDADLVQYDVLLMYPKTHDPAGPYAELSATFPNGQTFRASLTERVYSEDPLSQSGELPFPTFNGYSPSTPPEGLTAPVVYANYGTREDFETVAQAGVDVTGCICIVRYGANFRGSKTENANNAGCVGVLIYSDPRDYAKEGVEPENTFPNTRYLPETGVQRGSLFAAAGDPLTPGWAATSDALRLDPDDPDQYIDEGECPNPGGCTVWGTERLLPSIPTHPISYGDARPILSNMGGVLVPPQYAGSIPGVTYHYGIPQGAGAVVATLKIRANFTRNPIWNVVTVIPGAIDPEHVVVLGNHRDAWVAGAVDPSSGTAAVLETGRALAKLRDAGWRPRRTIVWCSWDAEEYMLLGSSEWAEQHDHLLRNRAISYINLDSAVSGGLRGFGAQATPQFDDLLRDVAKTVYDPEGEYESLYHAWKAKQNMRLPSSSGHSQEHDSTAGPEPQVGRLGSGSDYTPFIQHLGIPSISLGYSGEYPVYHSQYDSLYWMENFGDEQTENCPTGFCRHAAISTYVGALVMRLADDKVLPFNYTNYAVVMRGYADNLQYSNAPRGIRDAPPDSGVSLSAMYRSLNRLDRVTTEVAAEMRAMAAGDADPAQVRDLNDRLTLAERALCTREGLRDRSWFKHLVYAPGFFNSYGTDHFPAITDALCHTLDTDSSCIPDWKYTRQAIARTTEAINELIDVLQPTSVSFRSTI